MGWEVEGITFFCAFLKMSLKVIFHPKVIKVPEISRTGKLSFTSNSKKKKKKKAVKHVTMELIINLYRLIFP